MSTGESLFLIFILGAIGYGIYKVHKGKRWKSVGKGALALIGLIIIIGVINLVYSWYSSRPYKVDTLREVSLGMSSVEVTVQLGAPDSDFVDDDGKKRYAYLNHSGNLDYLINFDEYDSVVRICSEDRFNKIFGLGVLSDEKEIIQKIGQPTKTSINEEGLIKLISYNQYNVAFGIEKGRIRMVCVTDSEINFISEYQN